MVSTLTNNYACVNYDPPYKYQYIVDEAMDGQKIHRNVVKIYSQADYNRYEDDNAFRESNGVRYGGSEYYNFYTLTEGIPSQETCNEIKNCNFGWTNEEWELIENKCFIKIFCIEGETKCVEDNLYKCESSEWVNKNKVSGECGIECINDLDCLDDTLGNPFCGGGNVAQILTDYSCDNNKCLSIEIEQIKEECEFGCEEGVCIEDTTPIIIDKEDDTNLILIILIASVFILVFGVILYLIFKKK